MLFHCLLAFIASDKEFAVNLIKPPQYMMSHFSLTIFKILSLSLTQTHMKEGPCENNMEKMTIYKPRREVQKK